MRWKRLLAIGTEGMRTLLAEKVMYWIPGQEKWWILPDRSRMFASEWKPDEVLSQAIMVLNAMIEAGWCYHITGHGRKVRCTFWLSYNPVVGGESQGTFAEAVAWSATRALENASRPRHWSYI